MENKNLRVSSKKKLGTVLRSFILFISILEICLISLNCYSATGESEVKDLIVVEDFCENSMSHKEFIRRFGVEILSQQSRRKILVDGFVKEKYLPCKNAISHYLKKVLTEEIPSFDKGLYAFISIGLIAKIPEASLFVEKQISEGNLNDWIDDLEKENNELYGTALRKWADQVSQGLRHMPRKNEIQDLNKNELPNQTPEYSLELFKFWNPILMVKYISYLTEHPSSVLFGDFSNINAIYAFSNTSFREVFGEQLSTLTRRLSDKWVATIRSEPAWIIFRLMPLLVLTRDGNVKRELIWLSENYADFKVRSVASDALEKIISRTSYVDSK